MLAHIDGFLTGDAVSSSVSTNGTRLDRKGNIAAGFALCHSLADSDVRCVLQAAEAATSHVLSPAGSRPLYHTAMASEIRAKDLVGTRAAFAADDTGLSRQNSARCLVKLFSCCSFL